MELSSLRNRRQEVVQIPGEERRGERLRRPHHPTGPVLPDASTVLT